MHTSVNARITGFWDVNHNHGKATLVEFLGKRRKCHPLQPSHPKHLLSVVGGILSETDSEEEMRMQEWVERELG